MIYQCVLLLGILYVNYMFYSCFHLHISYIALLERYFLWITFTSMALQTQGSFIFIQFFEKISISRELVQAFLDTMQKTGADFTNCFRCLSRLPLPGSSDFEVKSSTVLDYLVSQSSSLAEIKIANKPSVDKRLGLVL